MIQEKVLHHVDCNYEIGDWIETQDPAKWSAHGSRHQSMYWVTDDLYLLLLLKWSNYKR